MSALTDDEIETADTEDKVYLSAKIGMLDAIEDIELKISI